MKNILFVNYYGYKKGGGASAAAFVLAKALREKGYNVFFASTGEFPGFQTFIFKKFRVLPIFGLRDFYLDIYLRKIIKEKKIDLIHVCDNRFCSLGSLRAARKKNIPCIIHYHDYWFGCLRGDLLYRSREECGGMAFFKCLKCQKKSRILWETYKYRYFKKKINEMKRADAHIAVSGYLLKALNNCGIKDRVYKVFNIINDFPSSNAAEEREILDFVRGKNVVCFVGRLVREKGIVNFLDIAEIISKRDKNIVFLIVGGGPMEGYLKSFIKERNLGTAVKLIGYVDHKNVNYFYRLSDLVFLPTLYRETFHMCALEAMGNSKVVITSDSGANKEIIFNGVNGFLIDPDNYNQCVDTVLKLIKNKDLRIRVGKEAKKRSEDFSGEIILNKITEIYSNIFNKI